MSDEKQLLQRLHRAHAYQLELQQLVGQLRADLASARADAAALAADRDAKTEELRLMRPVIEAGAAIPADNLIALTARKGRRMAKWAQAELARRNGRTVP